MDSRLDDRLDGLDDSSIGRNVRCTSGDSGVLDSLEVGRMTAVGLCEWALDSLEAGRMTAVGLCEWALDSLEVGRTTVAALCEWALSSLCSPSDRSQVSERSRVGTVPAVMPRLAA